MSEPKPEEQPAPIPIDDDAAFEAYRDEQAAAQERWFEDMYFDAHYRPWGIE